MEFTRSQTYILIAVAAVMLIGLFLFFGLRPGTLERADLKVWGFEEEFVYKNLLLSFRASYPQVSVTYVKKSPETYEGELLNAMASGQGPDVFLIHNTWLPKFQDKMSPAPASMITLKDYSETFVDAAIQDFVTEGYIWAVPYYVDTLALYWNKDYLNSAGIPQPPKTWDEFMEAVQRLTQKDEGGNITRSGAALGTAGNINSAEDMVMLLMLQGGAKMNNNEKTRVAFAETVLYNGEYIKPGESALRFYTDFANPQKVVYSWNNRMSTSLESFIQGKTSMIFDYSSAVDEIISKAPYLNFGISSMPQIRTSATAVNYPNYLAQAVWANSKNKIAAWQFILWMSKPENIQQYAQFAKKPVSRRDLVNWQKDDPVLGIFAVQALSARSWYQIDNRAVKDIFNEMITSVVLGRLTPKDAVETASNQINTIMIAKQQPAPYMPETPF